MAVGGFGTYLQLPRVRGRQHEGVAEIRTLVDEGAYFPLNTGLRFSSSALTASLWSSVVWHMAWSAAQLSRKSCRLAACDWRNSVFTIRAVTGGRVLVDGQDVRHVTQESLRAVIGIVPQDTVLFNESIHYNLSYGRPDASRAEIERAGGREVCFLATVDGDRIVRDPRAVARGNFEAVLVAARDAPVGGVMLHNHPSGSLEPSDADMRVAGHVYEQGLGTAIVDNAAKRIYVVVEPPAPREVVPLDRTDLAAIIAHCAQSLLDKAA